MLKFEVASSNEGTQLNFDKTNALANLDPTIVKLKDNMLNSEWIIVDIDNILNGNPHAV